MSYQYGARRYRPVKGGGNRRGPIDLGVGTGVCRRGWEIFVAATATCAGLSPGLHRGTVNNEFLESEPLVDGSAVVSGDGVGKEQFDLGGLEEAGVVAADIDELTVEGSVG